ncbi:MAG: hypothetical protein GXN95_02865 [Methanococci archaeon]|nr:hypothetical protein [Methanococci archaeon]
MKKLTLFVGLIFALSILIIPQVSGLSGAISPPKIDIMVNSSNGLPQDVNSVIYIKNPNNFPVRVELTPTGDLNNTKKIEIIISKNNFTLKPGETVRDNLTFIIKESGKYKGTILTKISPLTYDNNQTVLLKASVVLPTEVMIMAVDSSLPTNEIIIAIFLIISIIGLSAVLIRKI